MPTLADIYSAIDSAKRRASDFIQNPGTSLDQMLGYANDRARNYNQQMVQAAQGFGAPARGQQATPEQQAAQQDTMETMAGAYNPAGMTASYKGSHTAPNWKEYGAPLHDLTKIMPADVYSQMGKQLYGIGDKLIDSQWRTAALKARNNPDAMIDIYRAVPKGIKNINHGDWVTTSPEYAKWHGENVLDGNYDIVNKKVKAQTLSTEGYPYEFGYHEQND
jgi:hypothetical protein